MSDGLRGDLSEADVAAVVRNNPEAVVDAIRNQAIEPSEVESDSTSAGVSDVGELLLTEYASASDAPAGSDVGIVGVTSDGHLLLEDGQ